MSTILDTSEDETPEQIAARHGIKLELKREGKTWAWFATMPDGELKGAYSRTKIGAYCDAFICIGLKLS